LWYTKSIALVLRPASLNQMLRNLQRQSRLEVQVENFRDA
jgi:hypothetical protein